jgi:hypothetical protein
MPMDPLIEVSTGGGKNMRETCARVLAAALMTGAIATVVGMSALFGTPTEAGRPIAAPPSAPQRSVRIEVTPAPHRKRVERINTARPVSAPARPVVVARRVTIVRKQRSRPSHRNLASTQPKPLAPAPAPAPAAPAQSTVAPTPAVEPTAPAVPPATEQDDGNNGNAYGHDKEHKQGHKDRED